MPVSVQIKAWRHAAAQQLELVGEGGRNHLAIELNGILVPDDCYQTRERASPVSTGRIPESNGERIRCRDCAESGDEQQHEYSACGDCGADVKSSADASHNSS